LRHLADSFLTRQAEAAGSTADRYQVVVHIDQRLLASAPATLMQGPPQRCELEDERVLAVETARRLSCDSSLVGIVEDEDGEPLNVGRKTRSISTALHRALTARDGGCRFPGCDRTSYTEGHHVQHWANGGETKLGNLVTLCRFHHRLVHEGGFGLRLTDDGVFVFTRPDGSRVNENGNMRGRLRGDVQGLFAHNESRGPRIDAETIRCKWLGERMDYSLAVGYLMDVREPRGYAASGAPPDHPS
jgi:hypothetical protein